MCMFVGMLLGKSVCLLERFEVCVSVGEILGISPCLWKHLREVYVPVKASGYFFVPV
jgi:hypothetical protein